MIQASILFSILFGFTELYEFKYHNYTEVYNLLSEYSSNFPSKTHLYSIGKSTVGKDLWVLAISDTNPSIHIPLRPEVKLIANIHGNEVIGKEILLKLIDYMLKNQQQDSNLDSIMKNMRVHFLPLMNPDGLLISKENDCSGLVGRYNNAGFDLNRNFPDLFDKSFQNTQSETKAILTWLEKNNFILSASFHGGALVANYPFDNFPKGNTETKSRTNDHDVFVNLSKVYSFNHLNMRTKGCSIFDSFVDGITNGAEWYPINGGMQDVNYWKYGCMEITLEVSCCKYPPSSTIEKFWNENKNAIIQFLNQANTGVKGIVKFENGMPAGNVTIKIDSREPYFKTNKNGEYYRILLPGVYNLSVLFQCGFVYSSQITVPGDSKLIIHNITLSNVFLPSYESLNLDQYAVFCSKSFNSNFNDFLMNESNVGKLNLMVTFFSFYFIVLF